MFHLYQSINNDIFLSFIFFTLYIYLSDTI